MGEYQKCGSRIETLIRSPSGFNKSAVESMSVELKNGDRNLGLMRCLAPYGYIRSSRDKEQIRPTLDLIILCARTTRRDHGEEKEPTKLAKKDLLHRKERKMRERYTQGKVKEVFKANSPHVALLNTSY